MEAVGTTIRRTRNIYTVKNGETVEMKSDNGSRSLLPDVGRRGRKLRMFNVRMANSAFTEPAEIPPSPSDLHLYGGRDHAEAGWHK